MIEVPLAYPCLSISPPRYVIQQHDRTIRRVPPNGLEDDCNATNNANLMRQPGSPRSPSSSSLLSARRLLLDDVLPGSASISPLRLGGKDFILTTSALLNIPDILTITLSWTGDILDSPSMIQLDLREFKEQQNHSSGHVTMVMQQIVKVQAFADESSSTMQLVVVDSVGSILAVPLTLVNNQITPMEHKPVKILAMMDYLSGESSVQDDISGSELQPTMICFLSSTVVCLALAPFVVTVDLESNSAAVWDEAQCREDMKSRLSSLGSMLYSASDLLLGQKAIVPRTPPTAALCVSTTPNPLLDPTFVFTLHSDASVRKWKMDPQSSLLPIEVETIECTSATAGMSLSKQLPLPSAWSNSRNSVSLCARLYERVYALSIHIKTNGAGYDDDDDDGGSTRRSECHLWVVTGSQSPQSLGDMHTSCSALQVPRKALSLVGMAFYTTVSRCTLGAILQSAEEDDRTAMIQVTYPPSNVGSILSKEPVVECLRGGLDEAAGCERARIQALLFGSDILQKSFEANDTTLEQDLHALDTMYMKYLFRPTYPRGVGSVLPPSADCVRRALAKLVPPGASVLGGDNGMSVELETLRAMYDWRAKENRKIVAMTPVRLDRAAERVAPDADMADAGSTLASPFAVYDAFVHGEEDGDGMSVEDAANDQEDSEELDQERASEVEEHENRWRRLLLQIWEEECTTRLPLSVVWLHNFKAQVIVRGGVTTVVMEEGEPSTQRSPEWSVLDTEAMSLLERIERDRDKSRQLFLVEQTAMTMVSQALLAVSPFEQCNQFVEDLTTLGRWAWAEEDDASPTTEGITDSRHERLENAASALSVEDLVQWSQSTPLDASVGLVGLGLYAGVDDRSKQGGLISWNQNQLANCQLRHAVCSLSVRCLDSVRRLCLSRCLLLLDLVEGSHASVAAIRSYLHSIAILWASAQRVQLPTTAFKAKRAEKVRFNLEESPQASSPPAKRLSLGDDCSSILAPHGTNMTTTMDVVIINISQTMDGFSSMSSSPVGAAVLLGRSFFSGVFSTTGYDYATRQGNPFRLPELGVLPLPNDHKIVTDYPKLALRLLAPFVAMSVPGESRETTTARKEALAECLLIESHGEKESSSRQSLMRQRACELLVPIGPENDNPNDHRMIEYAVNGLKGLKESAPPRTSIENFDERLPVTMHRIIYGSSEGVSIEIRRLCDMETVKSIFAPLVAGCGEDLDGVTNASITVLANTMLRLSKLMHRLTTLERHMRGSATKNDTSGNLLLEFTLNAIEEMRTRFPGEFCHSMDEYVNLWSRLFHHSVLAGQWDEAYTACVNNPRAEYRDSNLKRLVRAMVDSGALQELLAKCKAVNSPTTFVAGQGDCIDLYEIAAEILADAVSQDVYTVRAASPEHSALSDYQGALYSLHVSQKHWRRAAQAMDQRFVNAKKALGAGSVDFTMNLGAAVLRDGLIVEDLVLAAVGSSNSIELVEDKAHRFLVSGELGPFITFPIDSPVKPVPQDSRSKRTRGSLRKESYEESRDLQDRLSVFMTTTELDGRSIRSIALRTLFVDNASDPSYAKASLLREVDSSERDIDELFKNGYFHYGLLLARAMSKNYEALTGSSRPEGEDLFYASLRHMLYTYVVPVCLNGEKSRGDSVALSRPSLPQLLAALDDVGSSQVPFVSTGRSRKRSELQSAAVSAAAMALLRKLTVAHTTAASPVALDVASFFLNQEGYSACIPAWLERVLTGADARSANQSNGLFARRPEVGAETYLGDPSSLLSLYINHGMFVEACDLVTSILSGMIDSRGDSASREEKAPARLPEKGDIDFVPYPKIDLLWKLIDMALSRGGDDRGELTRLSESQKKMELALEKHFSLMKVSEMGLRSARTLQKGWGS